VELAAAARRPGLGPSGFGRWPGGEIPWKIMDQTVAMYLSRAAR
jgi:hypothetical protein